MYLNELIDALANINRNLYITFDKNNNPSEICFREDGGNIVVYHFLQDTFSDGMPKVIAEKYKEIRRVVGRYKIENIGDEDDDFANSISNFLQNLLNENEALAFNLRQEKKVGLRPCALTQDFQKMSRKEQQNTLALIDELTKNLKSIEKQSEGSTNNDKPLDRAK